MPIDASIYSQLDTQAPERIAGIIQQNLDPMASAERAARLGDVLNQSRTRNMQVQSAQQAAQREQQAHAVLASPEGQAAMNDPDPEARYAKTRSLLAPFIPVNDLDSLLTSLKPAPVQFAPAGSQPYRNGQPIGDPIPKEAKEQPPSNLSRLIAERDSLPAGDPLRKTYQNAIRKESETAKQITPNITVNGGGGNGGLTQDAIDNAAATYRMTGQMPALGMGGMATRAAILNRAAAQAKAEGSPAQAEALNKLANKSNSMALSQLEKQATMVGAFEKTANANADLALSLSDKVDRTGVPIFNKWIQAGQKSVAGNADVAKFHAANETFINEYAKIMSGSMGNTAVSDAARNNAHEVLSHAYTKDQYQQVISTLKQEMSNRIAGFNDQRDVLRSSISGGTAPKTSITPSATKSGVSVSNW